VLLLRHMTYRCHDTQAALVGSGLVSTPVVLRCVVDLLCMC
jgi:hypothetical protein